MEQELLFGQWESYTDLYSYLFRHRLFTQEYFEIPGTEQRISVIEIKAKAFEEIYAYLPTKKEMQDVIENFNHYTPEDILAILSEIPTKGR